MILCNLYMHLLVKTRSVLTLMECFTITDKRGSQIDKAILFIPSARNVSYLCVLHTSKQNVTCSYTLDFYALCSIENSMEICTN